MCHDVSQGAGAAEHRDAGSVTLVQLPPTHERFAPPAGKRHPSASGSRSGSRSYESTKARGIGMTTRRRFLEVSAGAAALSLAAPLRPLAGADWAGPNRRNEGLDILVLGGTGFIGPHVVSYAMDRGHRITLFNRGRTNTHLFPEAEKLVGDRNTDLTALEGKRWDAVIDNSGYTPDQVELSVQLLKDSVGQYLFTSTRAVYRDFTADVMDEDAPLGPANVPEEQWEGYGPLKVLAERAVEAGFGDRAVIVRPPIIVGPGDRTDRFTYWVDRIDDGGEIMAWGDPDDPVQFVDVRDLAEFFVHLLEQETPGVFNAEGPEASLSSGELLSTGSEA